MLTFENKEYREGWLEGVIRTAAQDLQFIERTLEELKAVCNNPDKVETMVSVMISRNLVMIRCIEDAIRRIDELQSEKERQNALKRLAAMNRRGKAQDILDEAFNTPSFLSHARPEDLHELDKMAGITPPS